MDFGKFDMVLLTTMSLAIVLMSITFPALGLTADSDTQNESDIPQFNISASEWDIAGDFPRSPGTPNRGAITWDHETGNSVTGRSLVWLDRPKSNGTSAELANLSSQFEVRVINWTSTGTTSAIDSYEITHEGQTILHDNQTWSIEFTVTELENYRENNMTATVEYEILESSGDEGGGLSAIPIVGGLFSTIDKIVSAIIWLGQVVWWFVAFTFEIAITLVTILFSVLEYGVSMLVWLSTAYLLIVSAAGSWASVILMIPAVLLFLEFCKIAMLGIKLLPFT